MILILLQADLIIYGVTLRTGVTLRPFRILRGALPIFYDGFVRKAFEAFLSSFKDIIVFLVLDTLIIISFALVANQVI